MFRGRSYFEIIEHCFLALASPPRPLSLNGSMLGNGLPPREIPLDELRRLLIRSQWSTVQAVWAELLRRVRSSENELACDMWTMVASGMMLPALKKICDKLSSHWPNDRVELDAEVLEGFLQALYYMEPDERRIFTRLRDAAERRGQEACNRERRLARRQSEHDRTQPLRPRGGNPDFVLAEALIAGFLTHREAGLIYEHYLIGTPINEMAEILDVAVEDLDDEIQRAVYRLIEYLRDIGDEAG